MLIERLEIEAIGPFSERMTLGSFDPGLNILAQPNEWGKSTVVNALGRAFFDRYTSRSEAIRQLRPAGTSLSPRISVVFGAQGSRYRIEKRFLDDRSCELSRWSAERWERTDESDRADQRIRELLGAPILDGVPKPETWGFLRYLWARQDEPVEWPSWEGTNGEATRRRLAAVSIDDTLRALSTLLQERAGNLFTPTGRVKTGSPLERAECERERLDRELAEVRARRAALEELEREHLRLSAELPKLERECATRAQEADRIRSEAEAAEKTNAEIERFTLAFSHAEIALRWITTARDTIRLLEAAALQVTQECGRLSGALRETDVAFRQVDDEHQRAQAERGCRMRERLKTNEKLHRLRGLLRLRAQATECDRLAGTLERTRTLASELHQLETALARLPQVTTKQLERWQNLDRTLKDDRVRLEAIGLRVKLLPDAPGRALIESSGEQINLSPATPETLRAAHSLRLRLEGWGHLEIHSGAVEPQQLEAAIAERSRQLDESLAEARLSSLGDAEAAVLSARDLDQQIRAARKTLTAQLGEEQTVASLEGAMTKAQAAFDQERALLMPDKSEAAASSAALEAEEQSALSSVRNIEREEQAVGQRIEAIAVRLETCREQREKFTADLAGAEATLAGNRRQQEMLAEQYPKGLDVDLAEAQGEFARAEARLAEARRRLPPNAETLPVRNRRAAAAAEDVKGEVAAKQMELRRIETLLEERGGEGIFERASDLEEKLASARNEVARLRTEGRAARLIRELMRRHEHRSIQTVLGPLEERLSEVFAGITGIRGRRVWFDEKLQVRGVGPAGGDLIPFDELSRGAREQLLLALRAAIALELSAEERHCLILDDVLVHTDAARHENVLDYLQLLADKVQVIVLTCHADRYRGIGRVLTPER